MRKSSAYNGNNIGRITTAGVITEFPISTAPSFPGGITAGPDGNVWFAENYGNNIGRITTAGVITEFPVPTAASMPNRITAGPDGNLWFTEYNGNKIGKVWLIIPTAVPTITECGMIILVLLLGIGSIYYLKRRVAA